MRCHAGGDITEVPQQYPPIIIVVLPTKIALTFITMMMTVTSTAMTSLTPSR